jgi:hypothetical protein
MSRIYEDDVGALLLVHTDNKDIPITATLSLIVEKPSGTLVTWAINPLNVNFYTGVLSYTTLSGDLDETGEYRVQVHGVFTDANETSNIDTFTVYSKLE